MKDLKEVIIKVLEDSTSSIPEKEREKLAAVLAERINGKFYLLPYATQESFE